LKLIAGLELAQQQDLDAIVRIYNDSIPGRLATADTEPVTVSSRREWFESHHGNRPILVFRDSEEEGIIAWVSFSDFYGRPAYQATAEVSIYIDPACQGRGLGKLLLEAAIEIAPDLELTRLVAYIFSHNEPSIRLFRRFGFDDWGKLPDVALLDGNPTSVSILGRVL